MSRYDKYEDELRSYGLYDALDSKERESAVYALKLLNGNGLYNVSMLLERSKSADHIQAFTLQAIAQQNWIIMRQLTKITKLLDKNEAQPEPEPELVIPEIPKDVVEVEPIIISKGTIKCPKCRTDQSESRAMCWHCGAKFIK